MRIKSEDKIKECEDEIMINEIAILRTTPGSRARKSLQNSVYYYKRKLRLLKKNEN